MFLKTSQAAGTAEPCLLNKVLDDYEEVLSSDPELKADIPTIGLLPFMGKRLFQYAEQSLTRCLKSSRV